MFIHSLWSLAAADSSDIVAATAELLGDFERADASPAAAAFVRWERTNAATGDERWMVQPGENLVDHCVAVYVLDPAMARLPVKVEGLVIGTASDLPALNSSLMDDLLGHLGGEPVQLDLRPDALADLAVYEARTVGEDAERSITYADPAVAAARFASDWTDGVQLTAATIRHERSGLLTMFADGQIWLDSVAPAEVPEIVLSTVASLWRRGMAVA